MEDIFQQSHLEHKDLWSLDSMDDIAEEAAGYLNISRDVYLLCDSKGICSVAAAKIREHEMHVSFHVGSHSGKKFL